MARALKRELDHGVSGVTNRATDAEPALAASGFINHVLCVAQWPGQSVELGHDEGIAAPAGCQRFPKSGPHPVDTGKALVGS